MNALTLPDVASQNTLQALPLEWVGMCGIALPVVIDGQRLSATADAGVSLDDSEARGIHMSRLYLALEVLESQELNPLLLKKILQRFLDSHDDLSISAYLRIHTHVLLKRPALVSPLSGWKSYPVSIDAAVKNGMFHVELKTEVIYSSTCPCSAALARQLIQQKFMDDFANKSLQHAEVLSWLGSSRGIVATPHSQRSTAYLQLRMNTELPDIPLIPIIDMAESALGTAVQTAVKRADEQAFALANGQNLMFCEDAARRLNVALKASPGVIGFDLKVVHAESLHSHDAVAESRWNWESQ
ncbi:GTP cyclohydrolase I [Pseudomonas taetrolens]|uniref:GTP cyclohydrolase FolE2 n=1 Tax=Pseudomonas taetrolens TaxID=47884 RepID=A0A0J6GRF3_PSETA|nr:GTP cyclohydrolase FolE2 [Pseudomonas taetrolens]KMM84988.1 GTP cyclohydrolase [Pseudomonas taetrolens]SEB40911.1 GTP cyclohydrolase I [Pseudomonas taetrolens]SQF88626.1 GTP cyclohydrolase FolE [Pseudomonas taetrolens]VEH45487.1 GTP cyclohydrolase FolE [Pseudomonas taetrolens]